MISRQLFEKAAALASEGVAHALVTVVRTSGSTPRKAGAKMLVTRDGSYGTIGGGRIERELIDEARVALAEGTCRVVKRHLGHELAMCCGGEMESFIEPLPVISSLVLVGAGHIHRALAPIACSLGFDVVVADDLEELACDARFPNMRVALSFSPQEWGVRLSPQTYIVVATRDHDVDQDVLLALSRHNSAVAYVGIVGSHGKVLKFKKRLESRGVSAEFLAALHGPVGIDIGAETPEEIAVSIAAELVRVRRSAR